MSNSKFLQIFELEEIIEFENLDSLDSKENLADKRLRINRTRPVLLILFIVYRYDSTTGTFTVPSGGDGFYYFSVYCLQI